MRNNQGLESLRYTRAFENAKWILTDNKSGDIIEYDYSGMSGIVIEAYRSHNHRFAGKTVTIRYLHRVSCVIYREGYDENVSYSKILPEYTIECYDWHYICNHCESVLDEIREKGQDRTNRIFCPRCFEYSEYR